MDDIRRQVNGLWKEALGQLEEAKGVLTGRIEGDLVKLRGERDRLLKRLGEQTYKLANDGKLPVPAVVRKTVDRLNEVIDGLVETQKRKGAKKPGSKKASEPKPEAKKTTKKTAKKASKKKTPAKKTAKKVAKKKTTSRKKA